MTDMVKVYSAGITRTEGNIINELAARKAKPDAILVEVGSWEGFSAMAIGAAIGKLGGHLYCIDHWKGSVGTELLEEAKAKDIYKIFESNIKALGLWEYVTPMVMDSLTASKEFEDGSVDFLFLDGDHRYEPFKEDLKAWLPKMKEGGLICGHDAEAYYSQFAPTLRKVLDESIELDTIISCSGVFHPGVIKGLYDVFGDTHSIINDSRIWYRNGAE